MDQARCVPSLGLLAAICAAFGSLSGLSGCSDSGAPATDGGSTCAASRTSGLWLVPFGPVIQETPTRGRSRVTVALMRGSANQGEGSPVEGQSISFRIINPTGDATLDAAQATTDVDGLAQVTLKAGTEAAVYQVEASAPGTCPPTFTVEVKKALRQLRALTPSPYDTFTASRVSLAVEATTDGNAKLRGEPITFALTDGKTSETVLGAADGSAYGASVQIKTNAAGRATAMLFTGTKAIAQLGVVASMQGTADVQLVVRVAQGKSKGCQADKDCPLSYTCRGGFCDPPPSPPPPAGCDDNADCAPPTVCHTASGQCLEGTGKLCDPLEGMGCAAGEVCVGRQCAKLPTGCKDNSECPANFVCQNGSCVPGGKPQAGGCTTDENCGAGNFCLNGQCVGKASCKIPHSVDRLQGTWQLDSTFHFRQALGPVLAGLVTASGGLRDIIEGRFQIPGLPSVLSGIVTKYLQKLIAQYVPAWGQQLVVVLGDVNDIVKDMHVLSTVQTTSVGSDNYVNSEQWDLVEFTYKGQLLSTPPSAIPEIGEVKVPTYTSHEICGLLFVDKHRLENVVGGIVKWGIDAALTLVTCATEDVPCYTSVDQALEQTIDCPSLALQLDQLVQSLWSGAPSIAQIVEQACSAEKGDLIKQITDELSGLTTKLSLLELSGTVPITGTAAPTSLSGGKWYGVLGSSVAKGNFEGEFSAKKP